MKLKRILANGIVLVLVAAAIFYIGWVQFSVKPGYCGIMVSKTGGVYRKPILAGEFVWRWERLLPTNVEIKTFPLAPYKSTETFSGSLPSASLYVSVLEGSPDFSYTVGMDVSLLISAEDILALVRQNELSSSEDLAAYLEHRARLLAGAVCDALLDGTLVAAAAPLALTEEQVGSYVAAHKGDMERVSVLSVELTDLRLPDCILYEEGKALYALRQRGAAESGDTTTSVSVPEERAPEASPPAADDSEAAVVERLSQDPALLKRLSELLQGQGE